jgi:hypothetical protein
MISNKSILREKRSNMQQIMIMKVFENKRMHARTLKGRIGFNLVSMLKGIWGTGKNGRVG